MVVESFWDEETVETLRGKISHIISAGDISVSQSVFTTKEQTRSTDEYFLTSGREIRFFWEEKAWKDGQLLMSPEQAVNKIGHGLHDLDPDFERVSYDKRVANICKDLGLVKPLAVQSMYIFKQAFVGGEVGEHQDGAFLYTEPQSVIGFWWALDDCTLDNGCLWAVPGSHTLGVHRRFRRVDPPALGTEFVPTEPVKWDLSAAVPLVIPRGSLVLLHSALVHFSRENSSPAPRHAYSIHVVDGREGVVYPEDNWLQRPLEFPFREIE